MTYCIFPCIKLNESTHFHVMNKRFSIRFQYHFVIFLLDQHQCRSESHVEPNQKSRRASEALSPRHWFLPSLSFRTLTQMIAESAAASTRATAGTADIKMLENLPSPGISSARKLRRCSSGPCCGRSNSANFITSFALSPKSPVQQVRACGESCNHSTSSLLISFLLLFLCHYHYLLPLYYRYIILAPLPFSCCSFSVPLNFHFRKEGKFIHIHTGAHQDIQLHP